MPDFSERELRDALGRFATGVTVVTTMTPRGPLGITANSFASVSLAPPLVLWSPARKSRRFPAFEAASHFAVHVLSAGPAAGWPSASRGRATASPGSTFEPGLGEVPLLAGCAARFECRHAAGLRRRRPPDRRRRGAAAGAGRPAAADLSPRRLLRRSAAAELALGPRSAVGGRPNPSPDLRRWPRTRRRSPAARGRRRRKGFRDYFGAEVRARAAMLARICEVYHAWGFDPLETSAVETVEALGKFLPDVDRPNEGVFAWQDEDEQWLALRYDLTAPLARVYRPAPAERCRRPTGATRSGRSGATRSRGRGGSGSSTSATRTPWGRRRWRRTPRCARCSARRWRRRGSRAATTWSGSTTARC